MTKLKKAHVPESESTMLIKDLHKKWLENDEAIRQSFATHDVWIALAMIEDHVKNEMAVHDQWKNELYQVAVRKCGPDANLWDSIHGKYPSSFLSGAWVWKLSFRRVK